MLWCCSRCTAIVLLCVLSVMHLYSAVVAWLCGTYAHLFTSIAGNCNASKDAIVAAEAAWKYCCKGMQHSGNLGY
jgi:succinate dehydrogenase hydrophobic anchor subunit